MPDQVKLSQVRPDDFMSVQTKLILVKAGKIQFSLSRINWNQFRSSQFLSDQLNLSQIRSGKFMLIQLKTIQTKSPGKEVQFMFDKISSSQVRSNQLILAQLCLTNWCQVRPKRFNAEIVNSIQLEQDQFQSSQVKASHVRSSEVKSSHAWSLHVSSDQINLSQGGQNSIQFKQD